MNKKLRGRDEEVDGDKGEDPAHQRRGSHQDAPLPVASLRESS